MESGCDMAVLRGRWICTAVASVSRARAILARSGESNAHDVGRGFMTVDTQPPSLDAPPTRARKRLYSPARRATVSRGAAAFEDRPSIDEATMRVTPFSMTVDVIHECAVIRAGLACMLGRLPGLRLSRATACAG